MEITSKSIHYSNFVAVFDETKFTQPDNVALTGLFSPDKMAGARFTDDNILRTKILDLPAVSLQIVIEPSRLRVEDLSQKEPEESILVPQALEVYNKLFSEFPLMGFGFNFDLYYRFNQVIAMKEMFLKMVDKEALSSADLRDMGLQFTLDRKGPKQETYFLKITAPIEVLVHSNHHFPHKNLPEKEALESLFKECYENIDKVIKKIKF